MKKRKKEAAAPEPSPVARLAEDLELKLLREYGPILTGETLRRTLGYRSLGSLRQAIKRRTVPIPVFPVENRRGKYALTTDAARWLAERRVAVGTPPTNTTEA